MKTVKVSKLSLRLLKSLRAILLATSIVSFGLGTWFVWARYINPARLNFYSYPPVPLPPPVETTILSGIAPVRLLIPALKIDLPVAEAGIVDEVWTVNSVGVSHLAQSVSPGLPGNSIFYGHNWMRLLGNLRRIKLNDEIVVVNAEGRSLTFRVSQISQVDPDDVSILNSTSEATLTLYTCSGFMDAKRLVVVGSL